MGQQLSVLSRPKQGAIDVKQQAAATDLIEMGVWYYNPSTGKNIWGNRAALQLYNLSADDFCGQQQTAWLCTGDKAALQAWHLSNQHLLQALLCRPGQDASAKLEQPSGADVTVHITATTATSSAAPADSTKGCSSNSATHAAFLPLPAGVLQLSARLSACDVLHKGKQFPAYLVQVVDCQQASSRLRSGSTSMRKSLDTLPVERNGNPLAALQLTLTQQLNLQPDVLPAAQLLALQQQQQQQQQQQLSSESQLQQQQQQGWCTAAEPDTSSGADDGTAQPRHATNRLSSAAATDTPGQSRLSLKSSSSLGSCQAHAECAAATAVKAMRSPDGGVLCGPEVQAAAQRLRRSFDRQAALELPAAPPAAQPGVGFACTCSGSPGSGETCRVAAGAPVPGVRRAHSSYARPPSHSIDKLPHFRQPGNFLSSGGASANAALPSDGSSSSSGYRRLGNGTAVQSSGSLPPLYVRTNSSSTCLQLPMAGEVAQRQLRLTDMVDNHAMFQFLFDAEGRLLAANQRALNNMREHLGEHSTYTLPQYLAIGQCDGGLSAEQIFAVISNSIFVNREPCFRLPQLRYSKRRPGKCRWVLYEMWGMDDPVTGQPALMVTEQNITQVKSVEEQYSSHMRQLEVQLEKALQQQQQAEAAAAAAEAAVAEAAALAEAAAVAAAASDGSGPGILYLPAIDTSSAAEKTLQLLDKLMLGAPVALEDVEDLRDALLTSSSNMHTPLFLDEQVLHHTQALAYDSEVGASLLQMLSSRAWTADGSCVFSQDAAALPELDEDGVSSSTAGTNIQASSSSSSSSRSLVVAVSSIPRSHSGIFTPSFGGSGTGPISPRGVIVAESVSPQLAVKASRTAAAAACGGSPEPELHVGRPSASTADHQQQQQQHWSQLVSAYPKVTADTLPAAAAAAAGCSMCPGLPATSGDTSKKSGAAGSGSTLGACGSDGNAARGCVAASAREVLALTVAPTPELEALLARVDDWQFDSFKLTAASGNRPLSVLGFFLFKRSNLIKRCGLDEGQLARWLVCLEQGYPPNPYHNRTHAADVTRNLHVLLTRGGMGSAAAADDVATLAAYMAAVVHDYEHRGVNNDFLVRSCDALALLYNDRSPHENHHLAASWGLLVEHDFLRGMPHSKRELLRRLVIEMVLATDMKQHFAIHGLFQSKVHMLSAMSMARSSSSATAVALPAAVPGAGGSTLDGPHISAGPSRHHMSLSSSASGALSGVSSRVGSINGGTAVAAAAAASGEAGGAAASGGSPPSVFSSAGAGSFAMGRLRSCNSALKRAGTGAGMSVDGSCCYEEEDADARSLYLQMALKAGDLGHLAAPRQVHKQWVAALEEENFRQGDRERAAGLAVSPLMDRSKQGISRSQVGFFDIVALPLYTSLAQRFPGCRPMLEAVLDNYAMWKDQEQLQQQQQQQQQQRPN